jgi:hypothetical protein
MMNRTYFLLIPLLLLISCNDSNKIQEQIDNLKTKSANIYKPGFGEFMTYIQIHHAKLWFAGKNQNWELANFELDEIVETIEAIKQYEKEREEIKVLPILNPALDSVRKAINVKDLKSFTQSFANLTKTCNACHQSVKFGFNVVKIPDTPPFSNQEFSPPKK